MLKTSSYTKLFTPSRGGNIACFANKERPNLPVIIFIFLFFKVPTVSLNWKNRCRNWKKLKSFLGSGAAEGINGRIIFAACWAGMQKTFAKIATPRQPNRALYIFNYIRR